MVRRAPLFGLMILCAGVIAASAGTLLTSATDHARVHSNSNLRAHANANDEWTVLFLECPLMKEDFGDVFGKMFNAYHSGMGFINKKTGEEFMVDYAILKFAMDGVLPSIQDGKLVYKKQSEVRMYPRLQPWPERWDKLTPIAQVSDAIVQEIKKWVVNLQDNAPEYQIFGLQASGKQAVSSNTCYDFCFQVIDKLYELGATFTETDHERDVFDLDIVPGTLQPATKEDETSFWKKVFKVVSWKELTHEDLLDALKDIVKHLQDGNPTIYFTIEGKTVSFQLTNKAVVAGYTKQSIPSAKAVSFREAALAVN